MTGCGVSELNQSQNNNSQPETAMFSGSLQKQQKFLAI